MTRMIQVAAALLLLATAAPLAGAGAYPVANGENLLAPHACTPTGTCAPVPLCVEGYYCQRTACEPAAVCEARALATNECAVNATIEGRTCQDRARITFAATPAPLPGAGLADVHLVGDVVLAQGNASLGDLSHAWLSHAVTLEARALGVDAGTTRVGVYRSVISTGDHADPVPGDDPTGIERTTSQTYVVVESETLGDHGAGILFFGAFPETCEAWSGPAGEHRRCPELRPQAILS